MSLLVAALRVSMGRGQLATASTETNAQPRVASFPQFVSNFQCSEEASAQVSCI